MCVLWSGTRAAPLPSEVSAWLHALSIPSPRTRGGDGIPIKEACADVSAWLHKPALENLSS